MSKQGYYDGINGYPCKYPDDAEYMRGFNVGRQSYFI